MIHHMDSIGRADVVARIDDWKDRLNDLYDRIGRWAGDLSEAEVLTAEVPQIREEMMQRFGVEPGKLPALAVVLAKGRVSFVPLALWVTDTNGRVNVTTNHRNYILVDEEGRDSESRWIIVNKTKLHQTIELDAEVFRKLILGEDLFA